MSVSNIDLYFAGEKLQCLIGIGISTVSICLAVFFFTTDKPVLKGIAYPSIPISLMLMVICVSIVLRTPKDILRVNTYATTEAMKLKTDELPRMEKVMANFKMLKRIEMGIFAIGIVLIVFCWNNPLLKGIGIGLVVQASIMLLFDTNAENRGHIYLKYLQTI